MTRLLKVECLDLVDRVDPQFTAVLEVEVNITCTDRDDGAFAEIEWVGYEGTQDQVDLDALTDRDQKRIETAVDQAAYDYGPEAYQEYIEGMSDYWHDRNQDPD